jgi:hypothetical protein
VGKKVTTKAQRHEEEKSFFLLRVFVVSKKSKVRPGRHEKEKKEEKKLRMTAYMRPDSNG